MRTHRVSVKTSSTWMYRLLKMTIGVWFFVKTDENGNHLSHDKQNNTKQSKAKKSIHSLRHMRRECIQPENWKNLNNCIVIAKCFERTNETFCPLNSFVSFRSFSCFVDFRMDFCTLRHRFVSHFFFPGCENNRNTMVILCVFADLYLNDIILQTFVRLKVWKFSSCSEENDKTSTYLRFVYLVAATAAAAFIDHAFMRGDHSHSRVVFICLFIYSFFLLLSHETNPKNKPFKVSEIEADDKNEQNIHWQIFANVRRVHSVGVLLLFFSIFTLLLLRFTHKFMAVIKKIVIKLLPLSVVVGNDHDQHPYPKWANDRKANNKARILIHSHSIYAILSSFSRISLLCWLERKQ